MKWLILLLGALLCGAGCASDKGEWAEFWKDVKGENMEMQYDFSRSKGLEEKSLDKKRRD